MLIRYRITWMRLERDIPTVVENLKLQTEKQHKQQKKRPENFNRAARDTGLFHLSSKGACVSAIRVVAVCTST